MQGEQDHMWIAVTIALSAKPLLFTEILPYFDHRRIVEMILPTIGSKRDFNGF